MRRRQNPLRPLFLALLVTSVVGFFLSARVWAQVGERSSPAVTASAQVAASVSASASAAAARTTSEIRVRDKVVLVVRAARGGRAPSERARAANAVVTTLLEHPEEMGAIRFEESQGTGVVYVGKTPVVTLGEEDVDASGEASLAVLGAQITARLSDAIATERKRSAIAQTVFSVSLLVFSGLIAFLLLGRVSDIATRLRASLAADPERVAGVRLGKIEFVSAGAARGALSIALTLAPRLIQLALAYGWLIFGLSLFDATRGHTERLTGMVITPLYGLAERVGGALPVAIVAAIAVFAVSVLVRFVGLFFDSVARGDTRIGGLSRDLARPTSALLRFGIIVASLVLASPLITGEGDGALSRTGLVALAAVALASTPLLASAAVGVSVVFARRMKTDDRVEFGGRSGRVIGVTLLDVRLEDEMLAEVSVPHILGLFHPTRVHKHAALATLDVVVDAAAAQDDVERVLFETARAMSARGKVELVYLDRAGAHWRVTSASMRDGVSLGKAVKDALESIGAGLGLGREP